MSGAPESDARERVRLAVATAQEQVPSAIERLVSRAPELAAASDERLAAGEPLGPFDGMPFAVKANIDVAGVVTTSGLAEPADGWWPAAGSDAAAVATLVAAGAIPVLTTTMAPMAMGSVTVSPGHGPCVNPVDPGRHAGGSSGGSGAVVGAGAVRLALGSDTLGSVRIPAAYCQVTGWIPTPGLVSAAGMVPLCRELDRLGVLLADPADLPAVISLLAGTSGTAPGSPALPAPMPTRELTLAAVELAVDIDAPALAAVQSACTALAAAGVTIAATRTLAIEPGLLRRRGFLLAEVEASRTFADALARGAVPQDMTPLLAYGAAASPESITRAQQVVADVRDRARALLAEVDVLVLPTTPHGAALLAEDPPGAADLTAWVNAAGLPAVAVPVAGRSVQLVGRPGSDLTLAELAARISPR